MYPDYSKTKMVSLNELKLQAKKLAKREGLILTKAQDQLATSRGYKDWQALSHAFNQRIGFCDEKNAGFSILTYDVIDLPGVQKLVGGWLEAPPMHMMETLLPEMVEAGISIYMDEQGALKKRDHVLFPFFGSLVFTGEKDVYDDKYGDWIGTTWIGLTDRQIKFLNNF